MESLQHAVTETPQRGLPEPVVRARVAFLRDFASLIADPKTRGKFVCYQGDTRVAVNADYVGLIRDLTARKVSPDSSLVFEVTPAAEGEEQAIADEAELP